jgi:hypothetical protein
MRTACSFGSVDEKHVDRVEVCKAAKYGCAFTVYTEYGVVCMAAKWLRNHCCWDWPRLPIDGKLPKMIHEMKERVYTSGWKSSELEILLVRTRKLRLSDWGIWH